MRYLHGVLLAASLAMISTVPAAAQTAHGSSGYGSSPMVITATGEIKKATMKGKTLPKGAKAIGANTVVVVMGDQRYLVPRTREFNEMFTY